MPGRSQSRAPKQTAAASQYLVFYKPYDVLCQFTVEDQATRETLKDYIPVPDVYPVGRLDRDSEGLVLLNDDGWLQHRLSDPRFEHPRSYLVQVEGVPSAEALNRLRQGLKLKDGMTRPAEVELLEADPDVPERKPPIRWRAAIPARWIVLTLREGRNRQVRRMTAALGYPTLRLIRTQIGRLSLTGLSPGQWRELTAEEVAGLRTATD